MQKPSERPSHAQAVQLPPEIANANPAARYEAWQRMRDAMQHQINQLNNEREDLADARQEAANHGRTDPAVEARIAGVDARLTTLHVQIAQVDQEIISAAALAPARTRPTVAETRVQPGPPRESFPEELIAIPALFILCIGLPLAIAYSRRIWRRAGESSAALPHEVIDRLNRMDQNIDAIALEIERIGENQRYLTKQTDKERANLKG
jgi:uncharacterized protein with HEPN domain